MIPCLAVEAMKRVTEIKNKREGKFVMDRLLKSQEHQRVHDIVEVRKGMSLIRSPAAGLKVSGGFLSSVRLVCVAEL